VHLTGAIRNGDPTGGAILAATVLVSILFAAVYFAPLIVAAVIRSRNLLAVALIDVLLGWTVAGWIVAWVLIFTGGRQQTPALNWPVHQPGMHGLSPDGMFWWDGIAWRDTRVVAPPQAPRSPDGYWWWDGVRWRPVPSQQPSA
jgi:hypothetical protein